MGNGPSDRDDYEWVDLTDLPPEEAEPLAEALAGWFGRMPPWPVPGVRRLLLVDLDNLRAGPVRWRARMGAVVALARQADEVVLAGQEAAVARAYPHLGEFAARAHAVPDGDDLADHVLLDGAAALPTGPLQVVVLSNDGIFATLAERGPLVVVSPGADALSDRLRDAADEVVDLRALERELSPNG